MAPLSKHIATNLGSAKALCKMAADGVSTQYESNISSVTDNGAGDVSISFSDAFSSSHYIPLTCVNTILANNNANDSFSMHQITSSSAMRVVSAYSGTVANVTYNDWEKFASAHGDLA